ncbi:MAG: hypothetical protein H6551_00305 [Chitinophagales bacterium]|nr:hypothetical protein [Chitinophagaceae bacterium]MCB9063563.1 hypothetical protein [Chitinophagales bacterium]
MSTKKGPLTHHPIVEHFEEWSAPVNGNKFLEQLARHAYRVCNYDAVKDNYDTFYDSFGKVGTIHFAVKANAEPHVLKALMAKGAGFEIATYSELRLLIESGLTKEVIMQKVNFGQTQKERLDIRKALQDGVRNFSTDNIHDIRILNEEIEDLDIENKDIKLQIRLFNAEGTRSGEGFSQSFNKRYGVNGEQAIELAKQILDYGMTVSGFTFHPGSGSADPTLWDYGIEHAASLTKRMKEELGISISTLNLSGGFDPAVAIEDYRDHLLPKIEAAYKAEGLPAPEHIDTEPGRWLVANTEVLIGKVSNIKINEDGTRIVTLTTGVSENGTLTGLGLDYDYFILKYGKAHKLEKREDVRANIHGRACADFDVLEEDIAIPEELHPDNILADKVFVVIHGAGAYSHYMERNFWCGITPPMKLNYTDFKNCITSEESYELALVNSYAERSGLPLKNAMTFITDRTSDKIGAIKGAQIAEILDNPQLLNKLGMHLLHSVADFVHENVGKK